MKIVPLIISLTSLELSIISICILIKRIRALNNIISQMTIKLRENCITNHMIYGFVRKNRNDAIREQLRYEDKLSHTNHKKSKDAYKIGVFVAKQNIKLLKKIENYMYINFFE